MQHEWQTRYARQISLPQIGLVGQKKLSESSLLVVGAGGLGAPLLLYLAAAGMGRIGVVDHDRVALSNLPRQVLYETGDIGRLKVEAAGDTLLERNSEVKLELHPIRLDEGNASAFVREYDIIADGSDNFATRLLVNDACHHQKKTLVSAAVQGFSGQISTYKSYLGSPHPCYQCFIGDTPPEDVSCSEAGILGPVAGMLACWQATEVMKELLQIGEGLSGIIWGYDGMNASFSRVKLPKDASCRLCGAS